VDSDAAAREDLASFERDVLKNAPRSTIEKTAPEKWIAALAQPELPIRYGAKLVEYLRFFKDDPKGQALMRGWLRRMSRYEHILRPILKEVGVPEELVFVAMAESGFQPHRRSRVGAAGLWQFMEPTGKVYGLEQNYWVDERHDIERSTYAAAAYLKDLRVRFGSWEMALAAFNGGYGLAMTAIARANSNNFWALCEIESGLPHATTLYVPKILAAALVGRNRAAFKLGPDLPDSLPPIHFVKVDVPPGTALSAVAKAIDEDPALIEELNAQLVRKRTPPGRSYPVRIPKAKRAAWDRGGVRDGGGDHVPHVVAYGETVAAIAQRYGATEAQLRKINGLEDNAELERGVVLLVPRGAAASAPASKDRLLVPAPKVAVGADQRLVFFVVTRSTTPRGLADAFSVPWDSIVAWNDLDPQARLQPGQVLQVVVPRAFDSRAAKIVVLEQSAVDLVVRGSAEHLEAGLRQRGLVRRGYKARKGDTLEKIGKRFDLTDGDLARINAIDRGHAPAVGELLVVYVKSGETRGTVDAPPPRGKPGPATDDLRADDAAEDISATRYAATADDPAAAAAVDNPTPSTEETNSLPGKRGWSKRGQHKTAAPKRGKKKAK
jgi:membrane-bound lytic murein transglycosylase D